MGVRTVKPIKSIFFEQILSDCPSADKILVLRTEAIMLRITIYAAIGYSACLNTQNYGVL